LIIQNDAIKGMIRDRYSPQEVRDIYDMLVAKGTFQFPALSNGLYPAAILSKEVEYRGYGNVWVRDNVHVAHALLLRGEWETAAKCMRALMSFFIKYRSRFLDIIEGRVDAEDPMNRPQIRFNGILMEELSEHWPHAQNDALGYFVWLYSKLLAEGYFVPTEEELETLELFPPFFWKINFTQDEDSGHWEEERRISASSIGAVVAGLRALRKYRGNGSLTDLIVQGETALEAILPWECVQDHPRKKRRYDSALLFLVYPLEIVDSTMAAQIVEDVAGNLAGDYGIRRYFGDSYYCPDYDKIVPPEWRSADWSEQIQERDALLPSIGLEAQWCIFDPIISIYFGNKYMEEAQPDDYHRQVFHFNRSLGQITGEHTPYEPFRCPELYYLRNDSYRPNPHVPLLWTQANLSMAFQTMEKSSERVFAAAGQA
jgi:phosphorylase kinase alpha/beta subunit